MAGHIRRPRTRRAVGAAAVAVLGWLVWRLTAQEAPPAEAMASVLGWGLGLLPVHVTLQAPHRRGPVRRVRRPAEEHRARVCRAQEYGSWTYDARTRRGARPERAGERERRPPEESAGEERDRLYTDTD